MTVEQAKAEARRLGDEVRQRRQARPDIGAILQAAARTATTRYTTPQR